MPIGKTTLIEYNQNVVLSIPLEIVWIEGGGCWVYYLICAKFDNCNIQLTYYRQERRINKDFFNNIQTWIKRESLLHKPDEAL
jgi:hypothetical protein